MPERQRMVGAGLTAVNPTSVFVLSRRPWPGRSGRFWEHLSSAQGYTRWWEDGTPKGYLKTGQAPCVLCLRWARHNTLGSQLPFSIAFKPEDDSCGTISAVGEALTQAAPPDRHIKACLSGLQYQALPPGYRSRSCPEARHDQT